MHYTSCGERWLLFPAVSFWCFHIFSYLEVGFDVMIRHNGALNSPDVPMDKRTSSPTGFFSSGGKPKPTMTPSWHVIEKYLPNVSNPHTRAHPQHTRVHTISTPEYTPSALQRFVYEIILIICAQSSKMTAIAQIVILCNTTTTHCMHIFSPGFGESTKFEII